ncbi:MAG TPA: N-6 DNA methylase [Gemmatimonadales bacterium]|nr:N-6 DNA methylase [Gemmatimonadales bacterium]
MDRLPPLDGLTRLADLPRLIEALGHTPGWQALPPSHFGLPARAAATIGHAGSLEWVGLVADAAERTARRVCSALAARGRLAAVLVLDPEARELALGVTLDRTGALALSLDNPTPGQLERLRRLVQAGTERGVQFACRALEILEGEDAGRRFFLAFERVLERTASAIAGRLDPEERRTIALVQLTRVLFLYFVQARGWLDGRPDFLRRALDDALARRRPLHRDLFRPLFFGTLNRPWGARGSALRFGRIPFLNGGLFEPHPLERRWRGEIPDACWRDAFDQVFERFHFTVHEDAPPGEIAPDMLGRVFEGLMAADERHSTGAFYTPSRLVARLVDATLGRWLAPRLGCDGHEAGRRLEAREPAALLPLKELTVLDPAVGSGAFLLGMLERLAQLRAGERPPAALRRHILETNLFGVDRNPMAVRLAELRLWLAVIAAEEVRDPEAVAPLPNLDGVVRQGDSLLEPAMVLTGLDARARQEGPELARLRREFVSSAGPAKQECARRLRQAEVRVFAECLDRADQRVEAQLAELLGAARHRTLFGERRGLDPDVCGALRALRQRQRDLRALRRRLRREASVPWFRYEVHFADVLARGGFDLVVGNPPWVRAEELSPRERVQLGRRYRCWRGVGRGFRHLPDLSVAFVERSLELLAPGGTLGLLLPAKLATAGYAARLRAELVERCAIEVVADLGNDPGAAFAATTYPAAVVLTKSPPAPDRLVSLELEPGAPGILQSRLVGGGPWALASPVLLDALLELRADHPTLGERFTPQLGLKTGANALFLDPPADLEPAVVRSALRGRDCRAFGYRGSVRLFYPHDDRGVPLDRLPSRAAAYARRHDALLRARVDYAGGPPWSLFRVRAAGAPHRVVWPDLSRQLNALALTGAPGQGLLPLNSCYVLPVTSRTQALALAAWLNSTWIRAAARAVADAAASGYARFNARLVADLPLPAAVPADTRLALLAERGGRGEPVQEELDALAADHLALTPRARRILAEAPGTGPHHRGGVAGRAR